MCDRADPPMEVVEGKMTGKVNSAHDPYVRPVKIDLVGISIVICSHNGKHRIEPTLQAIAKCEASFPVEVLLIDNGSDDGTGEKAADVWRMAGAPFQLRIIQEPELGLGYARRRGAAEAAHELIVFCDDDNWLHSDYLRIAKERLSDPAVGVVSGQAEPVFEMAPPAFVYSYGNWLAIGVQNLVSGDVTCSRGYVWGAGLALRRRDLTTIYKCPYLPIMIGRTGSGSVASGDDNELCWAVSLLGKSVFYDERLKLKHYIPSERLKIEYLLRRKDCGVPLDVHLRRFTKELDAIYVGRRLKRGFLSALRCLRHYRWSAERDFHLAAFLAAVGWAKGMAEVDRSIYLAHKWFKIESKLLVQRENR
jgi:glycosyltransferase involved in cell wall biosynthesis